MDIMGIEVVFVSFDLKGFEAVVVNLDIISFEVVIVNFDLKVQVKPDEEPIGFYFNML